MSSFARTWRSTPHRCVAATLFALAACMMLGCDGPQDVRMTPAYECYWGDQFADCGGNGTRRFACEADSGRCLWFEGGVVADGYVAWPCANGRICCEDGPDATYPHNISLRAASFFHTHGAEPWTRERSRVLDVSIEPLLSGELAVHCERDGSVVDDVGPCRPPGTGTTESMNRYIFNGRMRETLGVGVSQADGFVSAGIFLEIIPGDPSEPLLARVCQRDNTDGIMVSCEPTDYSSPECATEGSVRISSMPTPNQRNLAGVVVAGEVVFPSGLEVSFTVPL